MAGKSYHIFRPKIIDADKNWTWGALNIDIQAGMLTITIDQDFLNNAVYPVIVDPTFGNTDYGANSTGYPENKPHCIYATPASSGTATKITACNWYNNSSSQHKSKCALYESDRDFIQSTSELVDQGGDFTWKDYNFTPGVPITAQEYRIAFWASEPAVGYITWRYDDVSPTIVEERQVKVYNGWPDPFEDGADDTRHFSVYCSYTEFTGWMQDLSGMANANIGSVAGVSKGNIQSISGKE